MAQVGSRCLVTLDEARDFLKRSTTDDDDAVALYADLATALIENRTRRKLKSRTYDGGANNEPKMLLNGNNLDKILMREYPVTGVTEITATSYDGTIRTISIAALRIIDGGMAIQIPYDIFDKGNANITVTCTAGYLAGFHDQQLSTLKMATLRWLQVIWQDRELAIGRGANISVGGESVSLLSDAVPKDILSLIYRYERW